MSLDVYLKCQCCESVLFEANITHNLNRMAMEAGIYKHLWRPEELDITTAEGLIQPLRDGLLLMIADPERFRAYNPENGWGTYKQFIPWVQKYLVACEEHPEAVVEVSR